MWSTGRSHCFNIWSPFLVHKVSIESKVKQGKQKNWGNWGVWELGVNTASLQLCPSESSWPWWGRSQSLLLHFQNAGVCGKVLPPSKAGEMEEKVVLHPSPNSAQNWEALFTLQSRDISPFTASEHLFCIGLSIAFGFVFLKNLGRSLCENKQELSDF